MREEKWKQERRRGDERERGGEGENKNGVLVERRERERREKRREAFSCYIVVKGKGREDWIGGQDCRRKEGAQPQGLMVRGHTCTM